MMCVYMCVYELMKARMTVLYVYVCIYVCMCLYVIIIITITLFMCRIMQFYLWCFKNVCSKWCNISF